METSIRHRETGRPKKENQGTEKETRTKNKKRLTCELETQSVETSKSPTEMHQPQKVTDRIQEEAYKMYTKERIRERKRDEGRKTRRDKHQSFRNIIEDLPNTGS